MRATLLAFAMLLLVPAGAGAALAPAATFPAAQNEYPVALAIGAGGRGAVVTQQGIPGYRALSQVVVAVPSGKRTTFAGTSVLDTVRRKDGGADLLVRHAGNLLLRRVMPSGRILDLWSVRSPAAIGALARGPPGTVAVWPQGSTLRIVSRPDGGIPGGPRIVRIGVAGFADIDAVID